MSGHRAARLGVFLVAVAGVGAARPARAEVRMAPRLVLRLATADEPTVGAYNGWRIFKRPKPGTLRAALL